MGAINIVFIILSVFILNACSTFRPAQPWYYKGKYYLVGDSDCRDFDPEPDGTIICYTLSGKPTGYRAGMNDLDMQRYAQKKAQRKRAIDGLSNSFQDLANSLNSYANQVNQNNPSTYQYSPSGTTMYTAGECKGSVVNSRCIGTIIPNPGYQKKCYGPIVLGECKGPYY